MMMAGNVSLIKSENGAAGVEMALMLPLLLILMFAPFELSNYFWTEHKVVKGVRDGARYAARLNFSNYKCPDPDAPGDLGIENMDPLLATQIKEVTRTGQVSGGPATIANWVNDDVTIVVSCPNEALDGSEDAVVNTGIYHGLDNAPRVRVSTTVTYRSLFQTLGFDTTDITVSASSQAAVMGI
jgi:TadE-like protein